MSAKSKGWRRSCVSHRKSEVAERVFDPFFTTKPEGEGTGLGLSTVLGIVKQGAGHVLLDTEPHRGSTFQVLWPRAEPQGEVGTEEAAPRDGRDASDDRGVRADGEGVLLVDDDSAVRLVAQRALERAGYRVFPAADGQEALALVARHRDEIRVVVSDVVMPVMGGEGLLDRLEQINPGLRVVLMSGYSEREITGDLRSRAAGFLDKPFGVNELIGVVHTILNR